MDAHKRLIYISIAALVLCGILWGLSIPAANKMKSKGRPLAQRPADQQPLQAPAPDVTAQPGAQESAWGPGGDPVAFKKPEEVRALLGAPDAEQEQEDRIVWYYHREQNGYQGLPLCVAIHFMGGEVRANVHYPCEMMPDKLATARLVPRPRPVPTRTQRFSQEDFFSLVTGKTKDQIRSALGEPEILHVIQGKEVWQYQGVVQMPDGSFMSFAIAFEGEVAGQIQGG